MVLKSTNSAYRGLYMLLRDILMAAINSVLAVSDYFFPKLLLFLRYSSSVFSGNGQSLGRQTSE